MFLIRDALTDDLEGLHAVAAHLDSVNLPADRGRLRDLISISRASFGARCDIADRRFLFVLTDTDSGEILGSSMIFAQHGSRRAPHVYFDVMTEERYSATLDRHVVHRILRIGYNYKGLTEIGGLALLPRLRRHPERLGRLLFSVRFMYLALHRAWFRDEVLSELMPPLEPDGTSRLWEALGRRFTGLTYQEADRLSHQNKEFIRSLFPEEPIYATLLPDHVQDVIGQVGPATKGVEAMLRRIGFTYAHRIDPFDGGPHFHARIEDVTLVHDTFSSNVAADQPPHEREAGRESGQKENAQRGSIAPTRRCLIVADRSAPSTDAGVSHDLPDDVPYLRAMATDATPTRGEVPLSTVVRQCLGVEVGDRIGCLVLAAD